MPTNIYCKNCVHLRNDWCEKAVYSPDPDMERDCDYYKSATNADRIRAMSDEELNTFLMELNRNTKMCQTLRIEPAWTTLEWLKQEATE